MTLIDKTQSINCKILELSDAVVTKVLLFVGSILSASSNSLILNSKTDYVISNKKFDDFILTHQ